MNRCLAAALLLAACGQDSSPKDDTGTEPTSPTQPTDPTEPTDPTDPTDPTPTAPWLADVAFFQAVEIPVAVGDVVVGAEDRAAPLVVGREAVVRVHVGRPDGWDGALSVTARIGADTFTAPVDGEWTATLPIPASAMAAGVDYEVAVTEGATTHDQVTADLEAIETGVLRLRLVPFEVDGFVPDTSPAVVEGYRAALMAVYPVTDVLIDVAPVEVWTEAFDLGAVNVRVGVLQEDAMVAGDVDPDVYYYGMVTGVATREEFSGSTGTSENGGTQEPVNRAYFAVGAAFGDQRSEDTLIHEIGHTHGLAHTDCSGTEDDPDPNFPYADATIGVEGYDFRTDTFVPADSKDMMGYCYPRWVSDYHYAKLAEHVVAARSFTGFE
jgi:predicted Zn-dependent protease with MMP-like domain